MLTLCNTSRGRLACALGGVLIAVLALACLWAFSPSVSAGDGAPTIHCGGPVPPPLAGADKADVPALPPVVEKKDAAVPPPPPVTEKKHDVPPLPTVSEKKETKTPLPSSVPEEKDTPPLPPVAEKKDAPTPPPPPVAEKRDTPPLPPVADKKDVTPPAVANDTPPPPVAPVTPAAAVEKVAPPPAPDNQDIKQLVAHLGEIRAERDKLDEKERQTIQTIKKKYQDQKHALEQLERELRQMGINCDEAPTSRTSSTEPPR